MQLGIHGTLFQSLYFSSHCFAVFVHLALIVRSDEAIGHLHFTCPLLRFGEHFIEGCAVSIFIRRMSFIHSLQYGSQLLPSLAQTGATADERFDLELLVSAKTGQ